METASIYEKMAPRRKIDQNLNSWKYIQELCSLTDDDLNKTAIIDGSKEFTYDQMLQEWKHYASVFSALEMTEEQNARVGILGSPSIETIFAFYGLNMVGAEISLVSSWSAFNFKRVKDTIVDEGITDCIVTDDLVQQDLVRELLLNRKELGLRHIIILHVPIAGPAAIPMLTAAQEARYAAVKVLYNPICMESLLEEYGDGPIHYASQETREAAIILHTSGTTSGVGKPVPMSDRALNAAVARFMMMKDITLPYDHLVTSIIVDLSNSYGIIDQVHLPFAMGGTVAIIPFGMLNPWFHKAVSAYRISFLFTVNSMIERWMKLPEGTRFDFSSLRFVALGGTAVSASDKRRYHEFIEAHGGNDVTILNGYGLSELGAACCLSTPDLDDESIGYPMPGIDVRLCDDETGRFFSPRGRECEGVLYLSSQSMASPMLDGKEVIKMETINRKPYVCTNDQVRVDKDGRITYLGRANRFFLRDEGRKYESGKVEAEFNRLPYIENCGIVPVFLKRVHESLPMLVVKTLDNAGEPKELILQALKQIFIEEKTLPEDHIPSQVMLAETLPVNASGKVDLFHLNRDKVSGEEYEVEPVYKKGKLSDFKLRTVEKGPSDIVEQAFAEISEGMKESMSSSKFMEMLKKGIPTIDDFGEMISGNISDMNEMHQQMIRNYYSSMGEMFPAFSAFMPPQTPEIKAMREMMPKAVNRVPQMQVMAQNTQKLMMNAPIMMRGMSQAAMPMFHRQHARMLSSMDKMNKTAFEMTSRFYEYNGDMAAKWFDTAMKMFSVDSDETGEDEAEE